VSAHSVGHDEEASPAAILELSEAVLVDTADATYIAARGCVNPARIDPTHLSKTISTSPIRIRSPHRIPRERRMKKPEDRLIVSISPWSCFLDAQPLLVRSGWLASLASGGGGYETALISTT
jgi:hypothetical protein